MTDGFKLSELPDIGVALAATDRVYVTRGSTSYYAAISRMRLTASQISDATATGQALMAAANSAAGRTALGLGALAVLATVGTAQIDALAVTTAKMADLATDSILIGVLNRPTAFPTGAVGQAIMGAATAAPAMAALGLTTLAAVADRANDQSAAYTGQDNAQVGSVYAKLTDLNALRVGYEDVRAGVNLALARLRTLTLISP